MSCYNSLAQWYDSLTSDVPYAAFAELYEAEFARDGGEFRLLLDLGCGTGTLTWLMARRGYEMIGVDSSVDMLMQARSKAGDDAVTPPLWLCQDAAELDLYGTVDAAFSSLDAMNYIPPEKLPEVFRRLGLFVRPEGLLIFDIRTPEFLSSLDGGTFVDETEDVLCLWRSDYDAKRRIVAYGMDIFQCRGRLWDRQSEEHIEYVHEPETLKALLEDSGFTDVCFRADGPQGDAGRLFVTARHQ